MNTTFSNDEFELIVIEYQRQLQGFVRRIAGNREDAEEIVQDTFMRAYRSLRMMSRMRRAHLHLRAWLYAIARSTALNYMQKKDAPSISISRLRFIEDQSQTQVALKSMRRARAWDAA
jgi:RNA polymerase sigma-70 factor, ECF subfamily